MNSACRVDLLTHSQARERLAARPAVILPLGGCEPFGHIGRIGIETLCAERISDELSIRCRALSAPPLPFGCSTPFISFPGAAGVKPRTFVNTLCEIIHAYALQGATRVFLINAAPFNKAPAEEAAKRIEAKYGGVRVLLFDINTIIDRASTALNRRIDRADTALLAMAAYLDQESVNADISGINADKRKNVSGEQYRAWKKRGADPQKLRKLFPDGLLLPPDNEGSIDITPRRGKELFDRVMEFIREQMEAALL
ncbi:MAG: creatininase family protein [Chitinispirillales bacterium]|jgi:creatinine amidohydrolase/Fe(II)-dependent formamide hydrolase-like protein|nr:creatininase family protein [Chitinispirillales bacterium]